MFTSKVRRIIRNAAFFIAAGVMIAIAPSACAQSAAIAQASTTSFDALPAAVTPSISAKVVPASLSAQPFSTVRIPVADAIKPIRPIAVESIPSRRNWLLLSITSHSAAAFDAYSTRRSVESGNVETNPFVKPFAGSPAIYAALQASPLVMDYAAFKMQRSKNRIIRHMWWLPQSTGTAMSIVSGAYNLSISH
jgi:hypothetical protein